MNRKKFNATMQELGIPEKSERLTKVPVKYTEAQIRVQNTLTE